MARKRTPRSKRRTKPTAKGKARAARRGAHKPGRTSKARSRRERTAQGKAATKATAAARRGRPRKAAKEAAEVTGFAALPRPGLFAPTRLGPRLPYSITAAR